MSRGRRRSSLIVRFTAAYAALASLVIAAVLGFLYAWTLETQRLRIDEALAAEAEGLRSSLVGLSISEMAAVVTRRSGEAAGQRSIYVLSTRSLEVVAGNLPAWPRGLEPAAGAQEFPLVAPSAGAAVPRARGRSIELPSGQRLLVGRDVTDLEDLRERIRGAFVGALGLTVLLGVAAGYVFSRSVSRRLDDINASSAAVLAGDLTRRVVVGARGDEFDELADNLNRMWNRLEGLVRGMREVTDDVAHDLRSPISRLRSRIEVALMGSPDALAERRILEQTLADADHVLSMFNAVLTIALAESGEPRERFIEIDASAVARGAAEIYEPVLEDAGVDLVVDAPRPAFLRGEPHLLTQAIANLLDNATKYVPHGGRVELRVRGDGDRVRIDVADDGPGIPAAFRERAFERFSRVEESRSAPGSGLGLSLVRAVAQLHGGAVSLEDACPGLRVRLDLPGASRGGPGGP